MADRQTVTLGTWQWERFEATVRGRPHVVHVTTIDGHHYRVAPCDFERDKWRADRVDYMGPWEAINDIRYDTSEGAAQAAVEYHARRVGR